MRKKTAVDVALHFLKFRPRTGFEIERKLRQKKFLPQQISQTIELLKKEDLINDLEFAKMWIENRNSLSPRGSKLLFLELRRLGGNTEICQQALAQDNSSELEKAKTVLKQKKKIYRQLPPEKFRQKMIRLLAARGFSWDTIREVLHSPA